MRGVMTVAATAVAVLALSGCSMIPGWYGPSYGPDDDEFGEPIDYTDGSMQVEVTGGTTATLDLPLVGGSRVPRAFESLGFRSEGWAVGLDAYLYGGMSSDAWSVTIHRVADDEYSIAGQFDRGCRVDVDRSERAISGTVDCSWLRWSDGIMLGTGFMGMDGQPYRDEEPFHLKATFEATLAQPEPTRDPSATRRPAPTVDEIDLGGPMGEGPQVHASHILYSPGDGPSFAIDVDPADPTWEAARLAAKAAASDLRAVTDSDERIAAFALRAQESDDRSNAQVGGDLGWFTRDTIVPEFGDPLFDAVDPQPGDIIGPVRSDFGWHVILFHEARDETADATSA